MSHILESSNILCTGGAGTLGMAIAKRRKQEGWSGKFTVYSSDSHKHEMMRRLYPDVQFVQGDIRNAETLYNAMVGHDVCLHLAAVKVIPDSEFWTLDTIDVNVNGSVNVCVQAMHAGIQHVLGISTDKACHAANAYGATKYLMEKVFQEYSRLDGETQFHLVRYGNVIESNSSVIPIWKKAVAAGQSIGVTGMDMTRFWISPQQAVDLVISSLRFPSGHIYIPKMKALSIIKMAKYIFGDNIDISPIRIRPGEKTHETLLTEQECEHATAHSDHFELYPTTSTVDRYGVVATEEYSSDMAPELTKEELLELLEG